MAGVITCRSTIGLCIASERQVRGHTTGHVKEATLERLSGLAQGAATDRGDRGVQEVASL